MAKLSRPVEQALSLIAHSIIVSNMSRNVEGMETLDAYWKKNLLAKDRALVEYFPKLLKKVKQDLATEFANDAKKDQA